MTSTRRALLLGMTTWVTVHIVLALLMLEDSRSPATTIAVMVAGCALVAFTIRPRHGRQHDSAVEVWLCALAVPVVQFLALAPLIPGAAAHYSNWPSGALGIVLATLMVRGHGRAAVASAAAQVAVQIVMYADAPGHTGFSIVTALLIAAPAQLWLGLAYGIRREIRRNDRVIALYVDRAATESAIASTVQGQRGTLQQAQRELRAEILPLLNDVLAASDPRDESLRERAGLLALTVRDSLRARALMNPEVTRAVTTARARGITVQLRSEIAAETRLESLGPWVIDLLSLPELQSLLVDISTDPLSVIAMARLPEPRDAQARAMLHAPGWQFTATRVDDELIVRGEPLG